MPDEIRVARHWLTRRWRAKLPDGGTIVLSRHLTIDAAMAWFTAALPEHDIDIRDGRPLPAMGRRAGGEAMSHPAPWMGALGTALGLVAVVLGIIGSDPRAVVIGLAASLLGAAALALYARTR